MWSWPRPTRSAAPELLDAAVAPAALAGNLRDLARANRYLGGLALVRQHLLPLIAGLPTARPVQVLDVGTGGADIPLALHAWAARSGRALRVVGLDRGDQVLRYAAARTNGAAIPLVGGDAGALPFPPRAFDFVLCALTLHHLAPAAAVAALAEMARVARRAIVVADLERSWPAYAGTWLWSRACTANPLTRYDGPLSVRRAYTAAEVRALADAAGLAQPRVCRHAPFRLVLVATQERAA